MLSSRTHGDLTILHFRGGLLLEVWSLSRPLAAWRIVGCTGLRWVKWGEA